MTPVHRQAFDRLVRPPFVRARSLVIEALERRAGIRTEDSIQPEELGLSSEHQTRYQPSRWLALRRILPLREVGPEDVFIDLGSGMGRVVYQAAARYPFRRVIGVELSDRLHAVAVSNIERNRVRLRCKNVELVNADALTYEIPDDVTIVYLGNPFSGPIFQAVMDRLVASVQRNPRRVRLLYWNPVEEEKVLAAGFRPMRTLRGLRPGEEWSRSNATRSYELGSDDGTPLSNRDHWESIGGAYLAEWDPPARNRVGVRELEFILDGQRRSRGRTALDVGIGSGRILDGLLRGTRDTELWGIDLAQAMVDATRDRFPGEPRLRGLAVCDLSREPLPFERSFDFISAIRMLKYNLNWREMVGKLVAQLEPGGIIVFSMSNAHSLNAISRPYAIGGTHATRGEVRQLCDELGLEVLAEEGFTKLPHSFLSRTRAPRAAQALIGVDAVLARLLGGPALSREVFVAARRG
jgi:SAM-dependent methyltransferase